MSQKDSNWEEKFPELEELINDTKEAQEDFLLSGAKDHYELTPLTSEAVLWMLQNLEYEIFNVPMAIHVNKEEMMKIVTIIFQDGLNFSLTLH